MVFILLCLSLQAISTCIDVLSKYRNIPQQKVIYKKEYVYDTVRIVFAENKEIDHSYISDSTVKIVTSNDYSYLIFLIILWCAFLFCYFQCAFSVEKKYYTERDRIVTLFLSISFLLLIFLQIKHMYT